MEELHATEMPEAQILEVCEFIGNGDVELLANVTDTVLITGADIERYRLDQAATLKRKSGLVQGQGRRVGRNPAMDAPSDQAIRAGCPDPSR
jgi:ubiquinone/menaquinone biosynthesis C-methylase UbiE